MRGFWEMFLAVMGRVWMWVAVGAALLAGLAYWHPQQINVVMYKILLVVLAVPVSYVVDRFLFAELEGTSTRQPGDVLSAARTLARALVCFATVLGLTLGI